MPALTQHARDLVARVLQGADAVQSVHVLNVLVCLSQKPCAQLCHLGIGQFGRNLTAHFMQPRHKLCFRWNCCISCASLGTQTPNVRPMLPDLWSKFIMCAMVKTPRGMLINQRKGNYIPIVSHCKTSLMRTMAHLEI